MGQALSCIRKKRGRTTRVSLSSSTSSTINSTTTADPSTEALPVPPSCLPLPPLPPPPPPPLFPRLHIGSLPDIAHDAIASYLAMKDMHCVMETCRWLMEVYGGRVQELRLAQDSEREYEESQPPQPTATTTTTTTTTTTITTTNDNNNTTATTSTTRTTTTSITTTTTIKSGLSLIGRRPELVHITVGVDEMMDVVAEAMRKGYLHKLQLLEVLDPVNQYQRDHIRALSDALASGACPHLNHLAMPSKLLPFMGNAQQSRMEGANKGCCGLKSLSIGLFKAFLTPLLPAGVCEALEELTVTSSDSPYYMIMGGRGCEHLSIWLSRTKATHLRVLRLSTITNDLAQALCISGVAPRLQVLHVNMRDARCTDHFSRAIGGGAWPHLRDLHIEMDIMDGQILPNLIEAIGVGAWELTTLMLGGSGIGPGVTMAVARMLGDGGCPGLEKLSLINTRIDRDTVVELARALEGGAPCRTRLRQLQLHQEPNTSVGIGKLTRAIGRGALPQLEHLDLRGSSEEYGVVGPLLTGDAVLLRSLHELRLRQIEMTTDQARRMFEAFLFYKPCPNLKILDIGSNVISAEYPFELSAVELLAIGIERGALPCLKELNVCNVGMDKDGLTKLAWAIGAQCDRRPTTETPTWWSWETIFGRQERLDTGCSLLEVLDVSNNSNITDSDVADLAEVMGMGKMQYLRRLDLRRTGMTVDGVGALFRVLASSPTCPNLQELGLKWDPERGGGGDIELTQPSTERTRVPRQSVIDFMRTRREQRHWSKVKVT